MSELKLWLLEPVSGLPDDSKKNPWEPWYDKTFRFVVRADSEASARKMADDDGGDENYWNTAYPAKSHPWLMPEYSTCVELTEDGDPKVVISDTHWA